jgi:hypothetical protein
VVNPEGALIGIPADFTMPAGLSPAVDPMAECSAVWLASLQYRGVGTIQAKILGNRP